MINTLSQAVCSRGAELAALLGCCGMTHNLASNALPWMAPKASTIWPAWACVYKEDRRDSWLADKVTYQCSSTDSKSLQPLQSHLNTLQTRGQLSDFRSREGLRVSHADKIQVSICFVCRKHCQQ